MIKIEQIEVWGFKHAIRGARNAFDSWDKSDSDSGYTISEDGQKILYNIGPVDMDLLKRLFKAGDSGNAAHRKFMRQIFVSMDITAPLYFWKEFDTYKVGTTSQSCSTMHTIHKKKFELDDFSHDYLFEDGRLLEKLIYHLNEYRKQFLAFRLQKVYWWQIIQLLPSSYNQKRTITMSYENVANIIKQRQGHKLDEWKVFIDTMLEELPYYKEIASIID